MADEPSLELLSTLLHRLLEEQRRAGVTLSRIADDIADIKLRMTNTEEGLAGVNRRLDRLDMRVDRIERRLELTDAT